ncbi:hypothetical protein ACHQM5_018952 [Ranunculus cassubicifolius]
MAVSGYEQIREQRIKENMERMQKLGLFDLSSKLNSAISSCKKPRTFQKKSPPSSPLHSSLPPRRSSRLQDKTPISYSENSEENKLATRAKQGILRRVKNSVEPICVEPGSRPEIYTEEHEKLLGSCESAWDLSIDDGRRVYDQVKGKTCHQCRQKTLGHRTSCIQCNPSVQGQFCGDCLYIRYGENVLEANQNLNWICPPCRGICNCSLCRHAKGWAPTGLIYRKIAKLGYKSVAHYLIQTRRAENPKKSDEVKANKEAVEATDESSSSTLNISEAQESPAPLVHQTIAPPSTSDYSGLFGQHILQKVSQTAVVKQNPIIQVKEQKVHQRSVLEGLQSAKRPKIEFPAQCCMPSGHPSYKRNWDYGSHRHSLPLVPPQLGF